MTRRFSFNNVETVSTEKIGIETTTYDKGPASIVCSHFSDGLADSKGETGPCTVHGPTGRAA